MEVQTVSHEDTSHLRGPARGAVASGPPATLLLIGGFDASITGNRTVGAVLWILGALGLCITCIFAHVIRKRVRAHNRDAQVRQERPGGDDADRGDMKRAGRHQAATHVRMIEPRR